MKHLADRRLHTNVLWNVAGQLLPLLLAVLSIPILVRTMGVPRFGVLSIAWVTVGYLSLFDFGLGRALTRQVAVRAGAGRWSEIPSVVTTAMRSLAVLGAVGALVLAASSEWITSSGLNIPDGLQGEARVGFVLLAMALPFSVMTAGLRGVLEAFQDFRATSILRFLMGVGTYLLPLLVLPISHELPVVIVALVLARVGSWGAHRWLVSRRMAALGGTSRWSGAEIQELMRLGGWLTVSNMASPIMATLDRFLLGAMISVSAVAYYATPADALSKLLLLPVAVTGVLYPAFASNWAANRQEVRRMYALALEGMFYLILPVVLGVIVLARPGLDLWLGGDFASQSTYVVHILAFGVLANAIAQIPAALVQASGRPDIAAKIHLAELPLYLGALVLLVRSFGIEGAAMAWTLRMAVDLLALTIASTKLLGPGFGFSPAQWRSGVALVLLTGIAAAFADNAQVVTMAVLLAMGILAYTAGRLVFREGSGELLDSFGAGSRFAARLRRRAW